MDRGHSRAPIIDVQIETFNQTIRLGNRALQYLKNAIMTRQSSIHRQMIKSTKIITPLLMALTLSSCSDRFDEGYRNGYAIGYSAGERAGMEQASKKAEEERRYSYEPPSYSGSSTEVCGGGGVNVNGKHYSAGKTGCVRVMSDGTVKRY